MDSLFREILMTIILNAIYALKIFKKLIPNAWKVCYIRFTSISDE